MASSWDRELTKLDLADVRVSASSLAEAWAGVAAEYLVRSVLVMPEHGSEVPFEYEAAGCTVKDIYDALAAAYGLTWRQDERTGVAWLHPAGVAYDDILTTRVRVTRDQPGLPMQTGVVEPLGAGDETGLLVKEWGSSFRNTFDYAVDVPAGVYALRDLLNLCCSANPTKTFHARVWPQSVFVTAVNLPPGASPAARPGTLYFWDTQVGRARGGGAPSPTQLAAALAEPEAERRRAARNYLEAIRGEVGVEELAAQAASTEQALWACIGVTSVYVRSEEATHLAAIETMARLATEDFLAHGEPGVALITALELARLTRSARALEVVKGRDFEAGGLAAVIPDACRIAALSEYVREELKAEDAAALLDSLGPLAALVRSHTPGKLEFEPAAPL